ncbi:carbamate kinase [Aestuariirhabdus sp. Z084]|uniref:carbamate kinase n=1 Tax=Aestuariirhabdus haliotis TaxID=2918751 RepID=UPI00201B3E29|nr:carbamate kinase [Aestuariirhabdus haliotis]MCL6415786.1 carbamate kinase [Aestuariirhabdus haliotis]MCL6419703.1 carbamate kinase [Aestuariirhabdus haliotis]
MLVVIALGGNAILQRGEPLEAENQKRNIEKAAKAIAKVAKEHTVVLTHGNGPQVGLLALQNEAYREVSNYPLDVLGAETQGMIGYEFEKALRNELPDANIAGLFTQTVVDPKDPAFADPDKFVGPVYSQEQATELARTKGYFMKADGEHFRRVVPSPMPKSIVELNSIKQLVDTGTMVICTGGGGVPVSQDDSGKWQGVEAVVDKDRASTTLAVDLKADALLVLTDVEGVAINWGQPDQKTIMTATPEQMEEHGFAAGSMGPKVEAANSFVRAGGKIGGIGSLDQALDIVNGTAGTVIRADHSGDVKYH